MFVVCQTNIITYKMRFYAWLIVVAFGIQSLEEQTALFSLCVYMGLGLLILFFLVQVS